MRRIWSNHKVKYCISLAEYGVGGCDHWYAQLHLHIIQNSIQLLRSLSHSENYISEGSVSHMKGIVRSCKDWFGKGCVMHWFVIKSLKEWFSAPVRRTQYILCRDSLHGGSRGWSTSHGVSFEYAGVYASWFHAGNGGRCNWILSFDEGDKQLCGIAS